MAILVQADLSPEQPASELPALPSLGFSTLMAILTSRSNTSTCFENISQIHVFLFTKPTPSVLGILYNLVIFITTKRIPSIFNKVLFWITVQ